MNIPVAGPLEQVGVRSRLGIALVAIPLLVVSWTLLWSLSSYWGPFFFTGTWVAATLLMYAAGERGHPGWRRHLLLMLVAGPVWWWFELVNVRVGSWEYIRTSEYDGLEYTLLASLAFSTVVPALDSAWRLTLPRLRFLEAVPPPRGDRRLFAGEVAVGLGMLPLVYGFGEVFFPLVWVSPFLVVDGLVGLRGGRSILMDLRAGEWRLAVGVGIAGIWCGILWEFWNFWAAPKWIYDIPHLGFLKVFEMPILGYLGYVPFAWSIYQLVALLPRQREDRVLDPLSQSRHLDPGGSPLPATLRMRETSGPAPQVHAVQPQRDHVAGNTLGRQHGSHSERVLD